MSVFSRGCISFFLASKLNKTSNLHKLLPAYNCNHLTLQLRGFRQSKATWRRAHAAQTITGGSTRKEFNSFFFLCFSYLYTRLIMPSSVSGPAGVWVLTEPVLITGRPAPERWDLSWHPGLTLASINIGRGSPWSDYRREWIQRGNVEKQERRKGKRMRMQREARQT